MLPDLLPSASTLEGAYGCADCEGTGKMPSEVVIPEKTPPHLERPVWARVSWRPLRSLWDLQGIPVKVVAKRVWCSTWNDNIFGSAAELGYWFLFALFPTLVSASSMVGIAVRHGAQNYERLLHYLSILIPPSAYSIVYQTFNEITTHSGKGKITFGLAVALWAASAGFSAIQDSMNLVYKVKETRPYWKVRGSAVLISTALSLLITAILACLLGADFFARVAEAHVWHSAAITVGILIRVVGWIAAAALLAFLFALIYYFAPNVKTRKWRWLTPGALFGIVAWLLASFGLRLYLHFFNNYTATYGSLGAVIILLTWFYISGVVLLLGGEVNSEIEAAVAEKKVLSQQQQAAAAAASAQAA